MSDNFFVVIPTTGRPDLLRRTLDSLAQCRKPIGYRELVVVENGDKAGAEIVVKDFGTSLNARYLHVARPNKSAALNAVLETLGDGLTFFADDDIRLHPDTLGAYAAASDGISAGQFYGGPFGVDYESEPSDWLKKYLPTAARGWESRNGAVGKEEFFLGFNWAAFTGDIRAAGGFNPARGPGAPSAGQETDMQIRLLASDVKAVYVPAAMVWHYVPRARCSPEFALHWAERVGAMVGTQEFDPSWPFVMGLPKWKLRKGLKLGLTWLRETVAGDSQTRFDARYQFRGYCGYVRGIRLARREYDGSAAGRR